MRDSSLRFTVMATLVAAGCAIPERNNPFDSRNTPIASLRILVVQSGQTLTQSLGTRQTLFRLDASGSTDADGGTTGLSFAFDLDDPRWDLDPADDFDTVVGGSTLDTHLAFTAAMIVNSSEQIAVRTVRVRVTAELDASAIAETDVILVNNGPSADAGADLFLGTTGQPLVTLDAFAGGRIIEDPDGDPLDFDWESIGVPQATVVEEAGTNGTRAHFVADPSPRPYRFRLTVSDGLATSTDEIDVYRSGSVWIAASDPPRLARLSPDFFIRNTYRSLAGVKTFFNAHDAVRAVDPSDGRIWIAGSDGFQVHAGLLDRNFREQLTWQGPSSGDPSDPFGTIVPLGDGACLAGELSPARFVRIQSGGTSVETPAIQQGGAPHPAVLRAEPGTTDCWTVEFDLAGGAVTVSRLDEDGVLTPFVDVPLAAGEDNLLELASAPDGTIWLSIGKNQPFAFGGGLNPNINGRVVIVNTDSTVEDLAGTGWLDDLTVEPGGQTAIGLDLATSEYVRITRGVDGNTPLPELPSQEYSPTNHLALDATDGSLWFYYKPHNQLRRYRRDDSGTYVLEVSSDIIDLVNFTFNRLDIQSDPWTGGLLVDFASGQTALIPRHLRRFEEVPLGGEGTVIGLASAEPAQGGLWYAIRDAYRTGLRHTSAGGLRLAEFLTPSAVSGTYSPNGLTATPDGGAWISLNHDLVTYDLYRFDAEGEIAEGPYLGFRGNPFVLQPDAPDSACMTATSQGPRRVSLPGSTPVVENLDFAGITFLPSVRAGGNETCWFRRGQLPETFSSSIARFQAGETTPSLVITSGNGHGIAHSDGGALEKSFAIDPRPAGGVWAFDIGNPVTTRRRIVRFDGAGGFVDEYVLPWDGGINGMPYGIEIRAVCDEADDGCIDVWHAYGTTVIRGDGEFAIPDETIDLSSIFSKGASMTLLP